MKKNKAKKKAQEKELAILLLMVCIALEESKFELSLSKEDDGTIEFSDPLTDIQGCISFNNDRTCSIFIMDKTIEAPSKTTMKLFEKAFMKNESDMKNHSELLIDGGPDHNTLLYYYDIPIPEKNTTVYTFRAFVLNAVMNALRFRKVLDQLDEVTSK